MWQEGVIIIAVIFYNIEYKEVKDGQVFIGECHDIFIYSWLYLVISSFNQSNRVIDLDLFSVYININI